MAQLRHLSSRISRSHPRHDPTNVADILRAHLAAMRREPNSLGKFQHSNQAGFVWPSSFQGGLQVLSVAARWADETATVLGCG